MNRFTINSFKKTVMSSLFGVIAFLSFLFSSTISNAQTTNCGDLVSLTTSNFPGTTATSAKSGACLLCSINSEANVVNSNTEDYAEVNLMASIGGTAYVQVNSPVVFPAGTEAGMTFNPQAGFLGVIGLDILGKITVSTLLNGQVQQSQSGDNLINGDILDFFGGKQSVGFTTSMPFNQIRIEFATGLGLLSKPVVYHAYVRTGCFNFQSCPSVATVSTGSFIANGTAGQNGTISIPITDATAGAVNVTVSGSGFSVNPNPRTISVTSGQTSLLVPVVFNGSGTPGSRDVQISVTTSSGTKLCTVSVPVLPQSTLSLTNEALNLNLGNQNEHTGNAFTEAIPTGGVEITANQGKYNYYAVNCVTGNTTSGTATSTTNVLTSIAGLNPVTGASYSTNLYPNVNGTVVINRATGVYTYTKDAAFTGATAKFCVKVCDLDEISPCKQIEYNLTNVGTVAPPAAPSISSNPNPPVAGQSATFTASGCSGTVTWLNNGSQVGSGTTFTTTVPASPAASYTATCTVGGVVSAPSTAIASTGGTTGNVDLAVFVSNSPGSIFTVGSSANKSYGFTVRNNGTTTSTATTVAIGGFASGYSISGSGSQPVGPLAPGASQQFTVSVTASQAGASGSVSATIPQGGGGDTNSGNNGASVNFATTNP